MLSLHIDLERMIRACLNDPELRIRIADALDGPPAPILSPCGYVTQDGKRYEVTFKTNRDAAPGIEGFVQCDSFGWIACRLTEAPVAEHDAATISADELPAVLAAERDESKT